MDFFNFIEKIFKIAFNLLNSSSLWLMVSFIVAGILRYTLNPEIMQKSLGNKKISALLKSTISGMMLPICSCGVIPLGIGLYYSGAYLGPVLAFITATPMINPAAVILSYGLLGPKITLIYVISGFVIPVVAGILGNKFGGSEIISPYGGVKNLKLQELEVAEETFKEKIISGMKWSFNELSSIVGKYVILGMLMGGFLFVVFPKSFLNEYLGSPGLLSLGSISVIAAISYVCAVGHIPFIAALVASGASPGVALTFLIGGTGTNLPELISIWKLIGKRASLLYGSIMIISSLIVGYLTNLLIGENFIPVISFNRLGGEMESIKFLIFKVPEWLKLICSIFIIIFGLRGWVGDLRELVKKNGE